MPGVVREIVDTNIGHAKPPPDPQPFHQFPFVANQTTVYANNFAIITNGAAAQCGDAVNAPDRKVYVNNDPVAVIGDPTGGHGGFGGNAVASGSGDVFIDGV